MSSSATSRMSCGDERPPRPMPAVAEPLPPLRDRRRPRRGPRPAAHPPPLCVSLVRSMLTDWSLVLCAAVRRCGSDSRRLRVDRWECAGRFRRAAPPAHGPARIANRRVRESARKRTPTGSRSGFGGLASLCSERRPCRVDRYLLPRPVFVRRFRALRRRRGCGLARSRSIGSRRRSAGGGGKSAERRRRGCWLVTKPSLCPALQRLSRALRIRVR